MSYSLCPCLNYLLWISFIFIVYKNITLNTIYYYFHTCSLMIFNLSIMHMACCLTWYCFSIYHWLSHYIISIFPQITFYQSHTLLSYIASCHIKISNNSLRHYYPVFLYFVLFTDNDMQQIRICHIASFHIKIS